MKNAIQLNLMLSFRDASIQLSTLSKDFKILFTSGAHFLALLGTPVASQLTLILEQRLGRTHHLNAPCPTKQTIQFGSMFGFANTNLAISLTGVGTMCRAEPFLFGAWFVKQKFCFGCVNEANLLLLW